MIDIVADRPALVRRSGRLAWFTIAWNAVECVTGIVAGLVIGPIALARAGAEHWRADKIDDCCP